MERAGKSNEPLPNTALGLGLALAVSLAMWGLLYVGIVSVWPRQANHIAVEGESVPHVASLINEPIAQLPVRGRAKVTRKTRHGSRVLARVFNRTQSVN
jgi:hypothetical protein